jgi:UDP-N-acetylmuramate--alanine ligase
VTDPRTDLVDLRTPQHIHLVGIGGAGISAIGVILATIGHRVSGVDVTETKAWPALLAAGVDVAVVAPDELFSSTPDEARVVAHSTAFPPSAEDRTAAQTSGRRVLDRAGILAAICALRDTIAVAGTHGKTSTTAMLATLLDGADADPSFLIGSVPVGLGAAARWGGPDGAFAVEADESDGSFLELGASTAIVTNIDEDHLDFWGGIDQIEAAFDRFVGAADRAIVCIDDPAGSGAAEARALRVATQHGAVTVGEAPEARHRIHDVEVARLVTSFGLTLDGVEVGPVRIGTPGRHHARNAAVAVVAAVEHGVPAAAAVDAIAAYAGVARRFTVTGEVGGITVVDDYAHNPGKIRALIASAKEAGWGRVVVVFQPQRFTRTRAQGADFGAALAGADLIAVTDIYAAGETPIPGVSGRTVLDALLDDRPWADAAWTPTLDDAAQWVLARVRPDDLVLTVGAGDVHRVGPVVLDALAERTR